MQSVELSGKVCLGLYQFRPQGGGGRVTSLGATQGKKSFFIWRAACQHNFYSTGMSILNMQGVTYLMSASLSEVEFFSSFFFFFCYLDQLIDYDDKFLLFSSLGMTCQSLFKGQIYNSNICLYVNMAQYH